MRVLSSKTSKLKLAQPSIANLSDLSASEQESEKYKGTVGPQQSTGTQSRFLKKKNPASKDTQSNVKPASVVAKPQPLQSKMPTSAALKRLAEFENRHRLRYTWGKKIYILCCFYDLTLSLRGNLLPYIFFFLQKSRTGHL